MTRARAAQHPTGHGADAGSAEEAGDDVRTLERLGYRQELFRRMSGFSNFAISFSIICILAGGITSFHLGLDSVGGASIGLGWPLASLFALAVAATMAHIASAFPTAGGLYHWASILGGRGFGWATAWFNLAGLITVLAAINVGTERFLLLAFAPELGLEPGAWSPGFALIAQLIPVALITASQALFNHRGIRLTTRLTDFSGYWILLVTLVLVAALGLAAPSIDLSRLWRFTNYSGLPAAAPVYPKQGGMLWLFALGLILPAYTITGFDASAHTAEETIGASRNVPRAIVRSVVISAVFGWLLLVAMVLALPDLDRAAAEGDGVFFWMLRAILPRGLALALFGAIGLSQYLCGLATLTSASRMAYAFARDGGLPWSMALRQVSPTHGTPAIAIWVTGALSVLFTVYAPVYATISAVSAIFLYLSYAAPTAAGALVYGRRWRRMGPWTLGRAFVPLAAISVVGTALVLAIGMAPPNDQAAWVVGGAVVLSAVVWFARVRARFPGPPLGLAELDQG